MAHCLTVARQIPEFSNNQYSEIDYKERLMGVPHLILIAYINQQAVGFKVGYERYPDGSFYSWMGGVIPEYRQQNVAKLLAVEQEKWAKKQNYSAITFKTRNNLKPMLIFALRNGFDIVGIIPKETTSVNRILLKKEL